MWPYLARVIFGFLPSEVWRLMSIYIASGIDEKSEVFQWVRAVSTTLLAGVVANILLAPSGALAKVPLAARLGAMGIGLAVYFLTGRSVINGVLAGVGTVIAAAWYFAG
ncbi:MAG: AzlD domain-containing protein [Beijerinckiaceae bacterium]